MKFNLKSLGTQITIIACGAGATIAILIAVLVAVLFAGNIRTSEYKITDIDVDVVRSTVESEIHTLEGIANVIVAKGVAPNKV